MPSPFPGMDPFLEGPEWESFHASFIVDLGDAISPLVQPKYVARPQRRVYVEYPDGCATIAPVEALLAMPEERIETFLTIREAATLQVVTVVEVLSPSNKRRSNSTCCAGASACR